MDNNYLEFLPVATVDTGMCFTERLFGCTEEDAFNYDEYANTDITVDSCLHTLELTDLAVEINEVSTTINDSNANGATGQTNIIVASASGIMDDFSVMSGVNVTSTSVDPTVTTISGTTLTVSPAQFLQNTQVVTFKNAGRVINITGNINVGSLDDTDLALRFDIEKFIAAS